jgi:hypothetical protein
MGKAEAAVPGHTGFRVVRITSSSSLLSAGFCRKAQAPAFNLRSRLYCGSRAVRTMTGIEESWALCCKRSSTMKPSPAGRPMSRMIRSGRSFCAVAMAEKQNHILIIIMGEGSFLSRSLGPQP